MMLHLVSDLRRSVSDWSTDCWQDASPCDHVTQPLEFHHITCTKLQLPRCPQRSLPRDPLGCRDLRCCRCHGARFVDLDDDAVMMMM